ncbi:hypothetical protein [Desulfothermus okinawensis]
MSLLKAFGNNKRVIIVVLNKLLKAIWVVFNKRKSFMTEKAALSAKIFGKVINNDHHFQSLSR